MGMSDAATQAWGLLSQNWGQPLSVNSSYRDPAHNARVGGARNSQHTHGNAYDVDVSNLTNEQRIQLANAARQAGFQGFGFYDNAMHFDVGPTRAWGPSYSRDSIPDWARGWAGENVLGGGQSPNQSLANDTMAALGRSPIGGNQMVTSAQGGPEQEQGRGGLLGLFSDPDNRARMAIALEGMTLNPNTAYMQMLGADIKGRADERKTAEEKKQQAATINKSVEFLRSINAPDLADALASGSIPPGAAVTAGLERMKPQAPVEGKAVGDALVNPITGEVIYQGQAKDQGAASAIGKLQGDLSAGRISQEQYEIALASMAPAGMSFESDSQGNVRLVQGANAGTQKPLTEGQSKDTVYVTRAEGALSVLDPIAENLTSRTGRAAEYDPTGFAREKLQTPDFQVAKTAGDEFLQAILRKDTGAAITPGEQALYGVTYLPQPGDGPQQLEYKKAARRRAVEAIKAGLPPSAIIAQEKALAASGSQSLPPVDAPTGGDLSDEDLLNQYGG